MDITDKGVTPVESPGIYFPQDFYLKTLNFLSSSGQKTELKKIVREISYYEDIYTFTVSGYIKIEDAQGFIERLQLTGNEYIELNFSKVKGAPNKTDQLFRVYKIGDRKPSKNLNTDYYTMYFCSEELMLSEQKKISKSYKGMKVSDMISDILTNQMSVQSSKIDSIEETIGMYDFVIPRMKPFEAISWLSTYARPKATGGLGADMIFYETKDGFAFKSLQSLFTQDSYGTYKYQQNNLGEKNEPMEERAMTVLNYEYKKTFDVTQDISSGTFANRLISIDPLQRLFRTTDFNYNDFKDKAESLNKDGVTNNLQNRDGKALYETQDAVIKTLTSNANQVKNSYIQSKDGAGIAKDIFVEDYVPNRTAQLSLANYTVLKLAIPGDPGLTAGKVIDFNLMNIKPQTKSRELDKFYSGRYLVTAVRHIIQPDESTYQTILEVAKDSSKTQPQMVNNADAVWMDGRDS